MTDVNANIHIGIETGGSIAQIKALQQQINSLNRELAAAGNAQAVRRTSTQLMEAANAGKHFAASMNPVLSSVDQFTQKLEKNKFSLGEYTRIAGSQLPGLSKTFRKEFDTMQQVAESRVRKIATQYTALGDSVRGANKALALTPTGGLDLKSHATQAAIAAEKSAILNKVLRDGSTQMLNWGKNTQWAGRQLMVGFSIPLAALGTAAAKTFTELDKASVSFKRVYGDLDTTTQEMEKNLKAVKDLGMEYTKYGIAVSDTVDMAARAAATGATNETLMAATKETLRLATLGQMDYNTALEATISMQTAFESSNADLAANIDFLNAVENQTILTLQDMSLAIPRVAPVIKGLGGDVKDLAVMMTALREGGVTAEQGANALKSGLASLVNPTRAAQDALQKFGIDLNSIIAQNKNDVLGLVQDFGAALSKLDEFSQQQALEQIFGKYQYARIGALFKNINNDAGQAARTMDLAGKSAQELAQISERELSKISESTSVKFQASMERLKAAIAPIGEQFMKVAMPVIDFFGMLFDKFNNLPDVIKTGITVATVAIAGLGPVILMTVGLLANGLANLTKGAITLRNAFNKITGSHKSFQYVATAELEAKTATELLEGSMNGLSGAMLLQQSAIRSLIGLYADLATAASVAAGRMPSSMTSFKGVASKKPGFNRGIVMLGNGMVPGTGNSDTIPALLTPGESVITKEATKAYAPILQSMNDGTLQMHNAGMIRLLKNFRKSGSMVAGARVKGNSSSDRAVVSDPSAWSWSDIRNVKKRDSWPERLPQKYFDRLKYKGSDSSGGGAGSDLVVAHIHNRDFTKQSIDPKSLTFTESKKQGVVPTAKFASEGQLDYLPNSYVMAKRPFNTGISRGYGAPSSLLGSTDHRDFISLASYLHTRGVPVDIIDDVTKLAARQVNAGMKAATKTNKDFRWDESSFAELVQNASIEALSSSPKLAEYMSGLKRSDILFANDGMVPGTGNKDTIPALLTPGESVITKEATKAYAPILQAMNDGSIALHNEGDIPSERYRDDLSKPIRSHGTGGVEFTPEQVADLIAAERLKTPPNQTMLNAVSGMGYTNWVYGEPQMANDNLLTGRERGSMFGRSSGGMREQIMGPLIEAIAKEDPSIDLRNSPNVRSFIDNVADGMHEELTSIGDAIVGEAEFTAADKKAFDRALQASTLTDQERAAVMGARENIYTAQMRNAEGKGGRVHLDPKTYRNIPMPATGVDVTPFLTAEGNAARVERARQSGRAVPITPEPSQPIPAPAPISNEEMAAQREQKRLNQEYGKAYRERLVKYRKEGMDLEDARKAAAIDARLHQDSVESQRKLNASRAAEFEATQNLIDEQQKVVKQSANEASEKTSTINKRGIFRKGRELAGNSIRKTGSIASQFKFGGARFGQGAMGASMALGMASMLPGQMADQNGKVMGMDANMLSGGMMGASMLTGMLPMLGAAGGPIAAVGVAAGAVAIGLNMWRTHVDEAAKKSAEFGANLGVTSNSLNKMAKVLGQSTPIQRMAQQQLRLTPQEAQAYGDLQPIFESQAGQDLITELQNLSDGKAFERLSDYLKSAIASGMMDQTTANAFAKTMGMALNNPVIGRSVINAIKDQASGTQGMLDIANERRAAVAGGADMQALKTQKTIEEGAASSVIGSSIQIIQDFANAAALAKEEYQNGSISYNQYIDVLNKAKVAQSEYTTAMSDAYKKTEDFGATVQAADAQLALLGINEEQRQALRDAASNRNAIGFTGGGTGGGPLQDIAQFMNLPARYTATVQEITGGQASWGGLMSAWFQGETQKMDEELKAAVDSAVAQGMNPATVAEIADKIKSGGEAARAYDMFKGTGKEIQAALFSQNAQAIPGLETAGGRTNYLNVGYKIIGAGGDTVDLDAFIDAIPEEKRLDVVATLSGNIDPEMLTMLMGMSPTVASNKTVLGMAELTQARPETNRRGRGAVDAFKETTQRNETVKRQISDIQSAMTAASQIAGEDIVNNILIRLKWNGSEEDISRVQADMQRYSDNVVKLDALPDSIKTLINIDFNNIKDVNQYGRVADELERLAPAIEVLPAAEKNVALSIAVENTENGKRVKDPIKFAKDMLKYRKLISGLTSDKLSVRHKSAIQLIVEMTNENGESISAAEAANRLTRISKELGISEKELLQLPTDVITKVINVDITYKTTVRKLKTANAEYNKLVEGGISPTDPRALAAWSDVTTARGENAAAKQGKTDVKGDVAAGMLTGGNDLPSSSGGGGSKDDPWKNFLKTLVDQVKTFSDINASMKNILSGKYTFLGLLKMNQGIDDEISRMKLGPLLSQQLRAMSPDDAKKVLSKIKSVGKNKVKDIVLANTVNAQKDELTTQIQNQSAQRRASTSLAARGVKGDVIESITSDPQRAATYLEFVSRVNKMETQAQEAHGKTRKALMKKWKDAKKELQEYIGMFAQANASERAQAYEADKQSRLFDVSSKSAILDRLKSAGITQQEIDTIMSNGAVVGALDNAVRSGKNFNAVLQEQLALMKQEGQLEWNLKSQAQQAQEIISAQQDIIDLQRAKEELTRINPLQDEVDGIQKAIDKLNDENDVLSRRIDLRQRDIEVIDNEIDKLNEEKDNINALYDARLKALDEIEKANERIYAQQKGQLTIAQALSVGDIAGAAKAQQDLQLQMAQDRSQSTRDALELARTRQLAMIDDQIKNLTDQKKVIEEDIKKIQLEQRAIADQIYAKQQLIKVKNDEIRRIQDDLNAKYNNQALKLADINAQLAIAEEHWRMIKSYAGIDPNAAAGSVVPQTNTPAPAPTMSTGSNPATSFGTPIGPGMGTYIPIDSGKYAGMVYDPIHQMYLNAFNTGGMVKKYASGGHVAMDSVPAMLTPGEFVMRKYAVEKYGSPMLSAINNGSHPKYNVPRGTSLAVQGSDGATSAVYNYDINVNVPNTNASPDEIATVVMSKIKMQEDKRIRSNRI